MSDSLKQEYEAPIEVKIEPTKETITYRTSIEFHDKDKGKRLELSIQAPNITPVGCLQFLTADSLISYPMTGIFRFEVKQIVTKMESKITVWV